MRGLGRLFPVQRLCEHGYRDRGEVRAAYTANPTRWPSSATKFGDKADPAADYAAVRAQVETSVKLERAQRLATKAASDFSFALHEGQIAPGSPELDALLAKQKITLKPLAPFTLRPARRNWAVPRGGGRGFQARRRPRLL